MPAPRTRAGSTQLIPPQSRSTLTEIASLPLFLLPASCRAVEVLVLLLRGRGSEITKSHSHALHPRFPKFLLGGKHTTEVQRENALVDRITQGGSDHFSLASKQRACAWRTNEGPAVNGLTADSVQDRQLRLCEPGVGDNLGKGHGTPSFASSTSRASANSTATFAHAFLFTSVLSTIGADAIIPCNTATAVVERKSSLVGTFCTAGVSGPSVRI